MCEQIFLVNHIGNLLFWVITVLLIKIMIITIVMSSLGFSLRASFLSGLSLAQISEMSLFLVARAHEYRLISRHSYLLVVATTVVLLALTPLSMHAFKGIDRSEYKVSNTSSRWLHLHGRQDISTILSHSDFHHINGHIDK